MEKEVFHKLAELLQPRLEVNAHFGALRTVNGAISVQIRLAVAIRIFSGGSYLEVSALFGFALPTAYAILWQVVDAITTPEVGPFFFPQDEASCLTHADRFKDKSTDGVFQGLVASVDGLFVKTIAPSAKDTPSVTAYYSGSKCGYGINVQAMCTADYRFCAVSAISSGSTNDWVAWTRSSLEEAVRRLPPGFLVIGDTAYPLSEQLLTPYPGKNLPPGKDSFNFHLSQLRVKIEQSFGILVSTWGILWRPRRVQFTGRGDLITALLRIHNFLQDEKVDPVRLSEESDKNKRRRPALNSVTRTLPAEWQAADPAPSRNGETPTRAAIRTALEVKKQWRPVYNLRENNGCRR